MSNTTNLAVTIIAALSAVSLGITFGNAIRRYRKERSNGS